MFAPVTVTSVPPRRVPDGGTTPVTTGSKVKVKWSALNFGLVPMGVVTVTSTTAPSVPVGDVASISLSETTPNLSAAVLPKSTAVAPVNPPPSIRTCAPPSGDPAGGTRASTEGPT